MVVSWLFWRLDVEVPSRWKFSRLWPSQLPSFTCATQHTQVTMQVSIAKNTTAPEHTMDFCATWTLPEQQVTLNASHDLEPAQRVRAIISSSQWSCGKHNQQLLVVTLENWTVSVWDIFLTLSSEEQNSDHSEEEQLDHTHHQHDEVKSREVCVHCHSKEMNSRLINTNNKTATTANSSKCRWCETWRCIVTAPWDVYRRRAGRSWDRNNVCNSYYYYW